MSRISEQLEVEVPCSVAYDQWTQFESYPQFMDGVERVIQLDPRTLDWTATIATGDALGFVQRRVAGDLERFKEFIESRGGETGAWRGRVEDRQVR